jgi:hypothetical protein
LKFLNMKILKLKVTIRRAARFANCFASLGAALVAISTAEAHLTYTGRDFGSYSGLTNASRAITNQAVTGNYGWADAADGILGDSHRARAFRFHLDNEALVTLTVSANPSATTNSVRGLTPAFSVYAGLAAVVPFPASETTNPPSADHDFGEASTAWRIWWVQQNLDPLATDASATDGSWNALGDWKIGGDGDLPGDFSQLTSLAYIGSAASTNSSGPVTGRFILPAGDYTILIGGNDISNKTSDTAMAAHGIAATFTVTPAPTLSIAPKVFVAWPADASHNWVLQSTPTLIPAVWTTVTNNPVVVDGASGVVLDSTEAQGYFRYNYVP